MTLPLIVVAYTVASGSLDEATIVGLGVGALAWVLTGFTLVRGSKALTRERLLGMGG